MNKYKKQQLVILKRIEAKSNGITPVTIRFPPSWNETFDDLVCTGMFLRDKGQYDRASNTFEHETPLLLGISDKGIQKLRELQDEADAEFWDSTKFWIPTIISIIALLVAIFLR